MTPSLLLKSTLLSLFLCSLLIVICYYWVDPAFCLWIEQTGWRDFLIFEYLTYLPNLLIFGSVLYYLYVAFTYVNPSKGPTPLFSPSSQRARLLSVVNSIAISIFIKDTVKIVFGRYWPRTWSHHNPSFIHTHAYGFHWFHAGVPFQSFPSGHTTVAVAGATAIWILFPKGIGRWLALLGAAAVIVGILGKNYHFLGDCIGGAWLGATTACYVVAFTSSF